MAPTTTKTKPLIERESDLIVAAKRLVNVKACEEVQSKVREEKDRNTVEYEIRKYGTVSRRTTTVVERSYPFAILLSHLLDEVF
jgi:hypothetical protein